MGRALTTSVEKMVGGLISCGLVTQDQLAVAQETQRNLGGNLSHILIKKGFIDEEGLASFVTSVLKIPQILLKETPVDHGVFKIVPKSLAQQYHFFPIRIDKETMTVAFSNPVDLFSVEEVEQSLHYNINAVLADPVEVGDALQNYYRTQEVSTADTEISTEGIEFIGADEETPGAERLKEIASGLRVVRLANKILNQAIGEKASDIHIEPLGPVLKIRDRIDGILEEKLLLSPSMHIPILTRLKILAGMDITERRVPQDGRMRLTRHGDSIDLRVSTYPTLHGEKMVLRLLRREGILKLEDLGFLPKDEDRFLKIIHQPHGIFLVTGPTGSGKTTTLYAALQRLNSQDRNLLSIEDPIEHEIPGVSQAQVNMKAGLTFATALRAMLRQDPDVVMVGEIRDQETADIAVRAAITGHLVLSTLHTNTAVGAITRLIDLGVEPFLVASALAGVLAQRLVRRVCHQCRAKGCKSCRFSGYLGRTGIFELVTITPAMRQAIIEKKSEQELTMMVCAGGIAGIAEDGKMKVKEGITTLEEVLRVTEEA